MRILVFGGHGQLGTDLARAAEGRHELARPRSAEVDVADDDSVRAAVDAARPHAVVNLAAFHDVEGCEREPERAFRVNAVGALHVAGAARRAGARALFVSTDYVFDGEAEGGYRESDPTRPLNVYGVSKAAGERLVSIACPDSIVVRGSGLFGHAGSSGKGGNFVETMRAKAAAGEAISVVDDQVLSPTATADMAERILALLEAEAPAGVYHAANAGSCSWFEFAGAIFELTGVSADLSPRPTGEGPVLRPRRSVLLDTRGASLGLPPMRDWREALARYLDTGGPRP